MIHAMPVRTTITLDIKAPNTLPRTRDEWPAERPSIRCGPRRTGGPGSPPSEPRPICLITDGDPQRRCFYSAAVSLGRRQPVLPVGDFLHRRPASPGDTIPPVITAAGSRPFGCRPARAGTNRRTAQSCARPTNRYQETPFIVIRKHRSTSRRRRRHYCTISSRAALWGISRHADRLGTAGMGRNTCANQRPHLRLQSSAF